MIRKENIFPSSKSSPSIKKKNFHLNLLLLIRREGIYDSECERRNKIASTELPKMRDEKIELLRRAFEYKLDRRRRYGIKRADKCLLHLK